MAHFSLAVSNQWDGRDGQAEGIHRIGQHRSLGRLAQVCQEYLRKDSLIYLEGGLRTNKYELNGEPRYLTKKITRLLQWQ